MDVDKLIGLGLRCVRYGKLAKHAWDCVDEFTDAKEGAQSALESGKEAWELRKPSELERLFDNE